MERAEVRLGRTIREKYRLERVLGVGGMATVYLAQHRNGSRAAVKILHAELAVHDVHRDRFIREAYVANSIEHPGAVRVIDDDVAEDNCPFLVMELLEGETLESRRRRFGRLEVREVLLLAYSLCDTLTAAHAAGVVHRDIKPENLFLTKAGVLKVLDFGIARVRNEAGLSGTRTGVMMGTPAYMPPEQALGRRAEIDERTDLWAVGATMFTLLSGRFVHEAQTPEEMMVYSATQPPRPLQEVFPEIPLPIAEIMDKALAFKRDDRFGSAQLMRDAIVLAHQAVFGEDIAATPMPFAPVSVLPSSLRSLRNPSVDKPTMPAAGDAPLETLVERGALGSDVAPTIVEPAVLAAALFEKNPEKPSEPPLMVTLAPTRVEGVPFTQRSGEPMPLSARTRRRRWIMALAAIVAAGISVFVGIRHVTGDPVAKTNVVSSCKQHADCKAGERCDDKGQCVVATGCVSNAACVVEHGGKPAICRQDTGKCVALESDHCRVFSEPADLQNDATIWVGAMYPESDKSMDYGPEAMRTIDLARRDFMGLTGGLPPLESGGRPRPLAIVACDDAVDYDHSANHLVNEVGVQAILGFGRSKEVLDLASRYFIPKNILALASNTASMLSNISHEPGQPRMVFRVTSYAESSTRANAALVREVIEPELRQSTRLLGPTKKLKIAVLQNANASGTSITDGLVSALDKQRSKGTNVSEEVRPFVFQDSIEQGLVDGDLAIVDAILAFAPHILWDAGAPHEALLAVEQHWSLTVPHRPRYIIGGGLASGPVFELAKLDANVPPRLFVDVPATDQAATRRFSMRYQGAYPNDPANSGVNAAPYDAFYVFAYAAMSLGKTPITGANLARAVKRLLPPGEPIDVGPSGILPAFNVLAAGRTIDLSGAQTSLDFDLKTGDAPVDYEFQCFDRKTQKAISSGIFYRARTGHLEGSWKCP